MIIIIPHPNHKQLVLEQLQLQEILDLPTDELREVTTKY